MRPVRTVVSVDNKTGEVKGMETVYISGPQREPPYVKVYLDSLASLRPLPPYCWPVLLWLLQKAPYAIPSPYFEIGRPTRASIAEETGVKISSINHAVADLVKHGAILRVRRGLYQLNPQFFGRGEWKDIARMRETVRMTEEDKKTCEILLTYSGFLIK